MLETFSRSFKSFFKSTRTNIFRLAFLPTPSPLRCRSMHVTPSLIHLDLITSL